MKITDFKISKNEWISYVTWEELDKKMPKEMRADFQEWMAHQTCVPEGVYPWDLDRFLKGSPIID